MNLRPFFKLKLQLKSFILHRAPGECEQGGERERQRPDCVRGRQVRSGGRRRHSEPEGGGEPFGREGGVSE